MTTKTKTEEFFDWIVAELKLWAHNTSGGEHIISITDIKSKEKFLSKMESKIAEICEEWKLWEQERKSEIKAIQESMEDEL